MNRDGPADGSIPALSVMQPWSWLLANGLKDIENRTWPTRYRGRFLIHAGRNYDGEPGAAGWGCPGIAMPARFDMGGIVGEAEIVDCVRAGASRWFQGPYGFVVRNARPLPFRACRGRLGFFDAGVAMDGVREGGHGAGTAP